MLNDPNGMAGEGVEQVRRVSNRYADIASSQVGGASGGTGFIPLWVGETGVRLNSLREVRRCGENGQSIRQGLKPRWSYLTCAALETAAFLAVHFQRNAGENPRHFGVLESLGLT